MTNDLEVIVRKHVIVKFIKRNNIHMRACQRNINMSQESFREPLKQWHASTPERLIWTSANNAAFDAKWGSFTAENRLNVDQMPCLSAFSTKQKYLFEEGTCQHKEKVWISQSGSGLDKQQGTLQIYFCATGPQRSFQFLGVWANVFLMMESKRDTWMWTCTSRKKPG